MANNLSNAASTSMSTSATPAGGMTSSLNNSMNNGIGTNNNNGTGSSLTHGGRTKSRSYAPGITAGAEDVKYAAKYKDLKRKVKEIEADNDKILFKLLQAKRNIQRAKLERAILYERLAAIPASPPQNHQNLPPVHPPAQPIVQTHAGHGPELAAPGPQPPIGAIHSQHTHAAQIQSVQTAPAPVHPQIHGHNRQSRHSYSGQHLQQSPPPSGVVLVDVFPSGPAQVLVDADGRPLPRDWRFVQAQQPQEGNPSGEVVGTPGGQVVVQQPSHHERHHGRSHGHSNRRHHSRSRDQGQQQRLEPTYLNSNSSPHIRSRSRSSQPISASSVPPPLEPSHSREWSREYQQRDWEHGRHSASIHLSSRPGSPPTLMDASTNIGSRRHDMHELAGHIQMSPPPQQIPSRSTSDSRHHLTSNSRPHNHHLRSNASGRITERERGRDNNAHTRAPTPPFALNTERPYEDYNMDLPASPPPSMAAPSQRGSTSFSGSNPPSHQTRSSGLAEYERDRRRGTGARLSDLVNAEPETIHRSMSGDSLNNRRMHIFGNEESDIRMDIDNIDVGSLNGNGHGHGHGHGIGHHRAAPPEERDRDRNRGLNWTHHADRVLSDEEDRDRDRDRGSHTDATTEI